LRLDHELVMPGSEVLSFRERHDVALVMLLGCCDDDEALLLRRAFPFVVESQS